MTQLHKRFSDDHVKGLMERYLKKRDRAEIYSGHPGDRQSKIFCLSGEVSGQPRRVLHPVSEKGGLPPYFPRTGKEHYPGTGV